MRARQARRPAEGFVPPAIFQDRRGRVCDQLVTGVRERRGMQSRHTRSACSISVADSAVKMTHIHLSGDEPDSQHIGFVILTLRARRLSPALGSPDTVVCSPFLRSYNMDTYFDERKLHYITTL